MEAFFNTLLLRFPASPRKEELLLTVGKAGSFPELFLSFLPKETDLRD